MKRLYRDKSDEMIAGVCSGIGKYLDVDPTAIRLAFVLLLFIGGSGLWIYLVLWIIMPLEPGSERKTVEVKAEEKKPAPKKIAAEKQPTAKKAPVKKTPEKKVVAKSTAPKKPAASEDSSAKAE